MTIQVVIATDRIQLNNETRMVEPPSSTSDAEPPLVSDEPPLVRRLWLNSSITTSENSEPAPAATMPWNTPMFMPDMRGSSR